MNLIARLAQLVGFHPSYIDSYGKEVLSNNTALEALLSAMGYHLDDHSLQKSINLLTEKKWRGMLPPVHIAKLESEQHFINLCLPSSSNHQLHWQINTEAGSVSSGTLSINELNLLEQTILDDVQYRQFSFALPVLAQGYHQLTIEYDGNNASTQLIYAPKTCYNVKQAAPEKVWGIAAQLYSLTNKQNWGIGDFSDLNKLVKQAAQQGASVVGLNPLHPLFQANPSHISPYSPTSRCFLNCLYIDVTAVFNFNLCETAQIKVHSTNFIEHLAQAKQEKLIDYSTVAGLKFDILNLLFDDFICYQEEQYQVKAKEFAQFKAQQGDDLHLFATYEALYEHFRTLNDNAYGWPDWPKIYQQANNSEVKTFVREHAQRIDYFSFLQWLAHQQLNQVANTVKEKQMSIGLYLDLAVGCDGSGVDVWANKNLYVNGASVGAPPDAMNTLGQNWGLTPMDPMVLQQQGYLPLVKALRANMQYAGALRIDHILGLMRQYWVAPGFEATDGIYITFPFADILRIIALESQRNSCVVIGEDLGNVPEGFSDIIQDAGLLSYKVLFFECWSSGLFKRPESYPCQSLVTVSTHDIPTLTGWWLGRDLHWRNTLNLYPNDDMSHHDQKSRITNRQYLLSALQDSNVIENNELPLQTPAEMNRALSVSVQKYLALTPSHIHLISLEDLLENIEQVNVPGTIDEHPNWQQKLAVSIDDFWQYASVSEISQAMRDARPLNIQKD